MTPSRPRRAIILGGDENALSLVRNLHAARVETYVLNRRGVPACFSRYARPIAIEGGSEAPADWKRFLLGRGSDHLAGAVVLACSDEAIELIVEEWTALARKFVLEECPPTVRLGLLDKLSTYESARAAGIPVPGFWIAETSRDLERVVAECRFPVILKPRLSHHSLKIGRKYARANDVAELSAHHAALARLGIPAVIMEFIPGGDDRLCSYYTYLDPGGTPLLHFTKRVLRRYRMNLGGGTYHETTWNPDAAALGEKFFRHVGLRGLGNVEFKFDARDGKLKIIEANARFTAADALVTRSGVELARFVYDRLTGGSPVAPQSYRSGVVLWYPLEDFLAFRELRQKGLITATEWLRSISRADLFPYFAWRDPMPSIVNARNRLRSAWQKSNRAASPSRSGNPGGSIDAHRSALSRSDGASAR